MFDRVIHTIFETLFPPQCVECGRVGKIACDACLTPAYHMLPECFFCKNPSDDTSLCKQCSHLYPLGGIFWVFLYNKPIIKNLVSNFKYKKQRALAWYLAGYMERELVLHELPSDIIIVPVPLHTSREKERGFNQSYELAKYLHYPITRTALVRTRATLPQAQTESRTARFLQMRGAFAVVRKNMIAGKNILLVDDVATTGATLTEATRALKEAGAKKIYAIILAHG